MKIYLAARYSRREELLAYKADLEALGHTVTSEWLSGEHTIPDHIIGPERERMRGEFAAIDLANVREADCTISFTEEPRTATRGGRHAEFGVALERGQRLVNVGPIEHVFHCLPQVECYPSWEQALRWLALPKFKNAAYAFMAGYQGPSGGTWQLEDAPADGR